MDQLAMSEIPRSKRNPETGLPGFHKDGMDEENRSASFKHGGPL